MQESAPFTSAQQSGNPLCPSNRLPSVGTVSYCAAIRLVSQCQKGRLLFHGDSGERSAKEGHFYRFHTIKGGEPGFHGLPHRFRCYRILPCRNLSLIAEDTLVGTAAVGDEDGNDGMFFHKTHSSITDPISLSGKSGKSIHFSPRSSIKLRICAPPG